MNQKLGQYELLEEIGQGGFATVYRARHITLNTEVAIKQLKRQFANDEGVRHRFLAEAQTVSGLDHPHIVEITDFDEIEGNVFFVMPYIAGGDLLEWRKRNPDFRWDELFKLLKQTASALDYAHQQGVYHRDVKPSNILIEEQSQKAILSDFGLVRVVGSPRHTEVGDILGTPTYISPEQAIDGSIDGRSDQYSLAVVAYQFLVGELPFHASDSVALALKHKNEAPPLPSSLNGRVPEEIDDVLLKGLAKQPDERYAHCLDFVNALETAYQVSQQRRYRTFLEEAEQSSTEGQYEAAGEAIERAIQLLPHRPDAHQAKKKLQDDIDRLQLYQELVKNWQIATQQAKNVLELLPNYPDANGIFPKLNLRPYPRPPRSRREWLQQLGVGITAGLILAALILALFFFWITRELPPNAAPSSNLLLPAIVTATMIGLGWYVLRQRPS